MWFPLSNMNKSLYRLVLTACLVSVSGIAFATTYAPPRNRTVSSENGDYELRIDPSAGELSAYEKASGRKLWKVKRKIWLEEYFLSNDGKILLVAKWEWVKYENLKSPAVLIYREGELEISYTYIKLSKPRRIKLLGEGPIGSFWRVWRSGVKQKNQKVTIWTSGWGTRIFDLSAGRLKK